MLSSPLVLALVNGIVDLVSLLIFSVVCSAVEQAATITAKLIIVGVVEVLLRALSAAEMAGRERWMALQLQDAWLTYRHALGRYLIEW